MSEARRKRREADKQNSHSIDDFEKMPIEVRWLKSMAFLQMPVGMSTYIRITLKYPEYFQ